MLFSFVCTAVVQLNSWQSYLERAQQSLQFTIALCLHRYLCNFSCRFSFETLNFSQCFAAGSDGDDGSGGVLWWLSERRFSVPCSLPHTKLCLLPSFLLLLLVYSIKYVQRVADFFAVYSLGLDRSAADDDDGTLID